MGRNQKIMKLWSLFLAFAAVAAQEGERGKAAADEKGAQSCQGVNVDQKMFKCKHKKKKPGKRKRCRVLCDGASMKKIYCNDDGWGGKGGNKVTPNKLC